jgi:CRP-like cAMP-binding protein
MGGNVRGVTTVASGRVQLGVLDLQRLSAEYSQMSAQFKGLVIGLDRRLRGVTEAALDIRLGKKKDMGFLKDKKPIIEQSDQDGGVFAISKGEAYVVRKTKQGPLLLATLSTNDVFGQIPFLDLGHEPHAAALYGSEDMTAKSLDPDSLRREYDGLSTTFKNMLEYNATCVTVTTRLACDFKEKSRLAGIKE